MHLEQIGIDGIAKGIVVNLDHRLPCHVAGKCVVPAQLSHSLKSSEQLAPIRTSTLDMLKQLKLGLLQPLFDHCWAHPGLVNV